MLSIIIPQYNETKEIIRPLLDSLNNQVAVQKSEFDVTIVNDCSETILSHKFLKSFKNLNIKYIVTPKNGGAGQARTFGIENTTGEYLMFIDADDCLFSVLSLKYVIDAINKDKPDVVFGAFIQETKDAITGNMLFIPNREKGTWIHGNAYSRKFITENNITFPPELRLNEDGYFNELLLACSPLISYCPQVISLWRFNKQSTTRELDFNMKKNLQSYIHSKFLLYDEMRKRDLSARYNNIVACTVYLYFYMQYDFWDNPEYFVDRMGLEKMIWEFRERYMEEYASIDTNKMLQIYNNKRLSMVVDSTFHERETYRQFWERLGKTFDNSSNL